MKIIALGDTHGRQFWKQVVANQTFDKLVFIGDYFDSFDIRGLDQVTNFLDIIEYKEKNMDKVVLLIGNHDHHYFAGIGDTGTSGYQTAMAPVYQHAIEPNKHLLQMAYSHDNMLFTHAGVGEKWLDSMVDEIYGDLHEPIPMDNAEVIAELVNDAWKHKPLSFCFNGWDGSGDDITQTPIWIRPRSLMRGNQDLKDKVIQIVGHTGQHKIDIKGAATGGRYYFIDTLGSSREYLIWEDGIFSTDKV